MYYHTNLNISYIWELWPTFKLTDIANIVANTVASVFLTSHGHSCFPDISTFATIQAWVSLALVCS